MTHPAVKNKMVGKADNRTVLIKKNFNTADIITLILKTLPISVVQTKVLAQRLNRSNLYNTSQAVYNFLRSVNYEVDEAGNQYVPTPNRILTYNKTDCKGYAILTHGMLTNLGIPHAIRFARYKNSDAPNEYSHVYVIVPTANGSYITIDAVADRFNKEFSGWSGAPLDYNFNAQGAAIGNLWDDIRKAGNKVVDTIKDAYQGSAIDKFLTNAQDLVKEKGKTIAYAPGRAILSIMIKNNVDGLASQMAANFELAKQWWYDLGGDRTVLTNQIAEGKNKPVKNIGLVKNLLAKISGIRGYGIGALTETQKEQIHILAISIVSALGTAIPGVGTLLGAGAGEALALVLIEGGDKLKGILSKPVPANTTQDNSAAEKAAAAAEAKAKAETEAKKEKTKQIFTVVGLMSAAAALYFSIKK